MSRTKSPRMSLRGQVAKLTAQLNEERQEHARQNRELQETIERLTESAESYRRAAQERLQAVETVAARELSAAKEGELKALRELTAALSVSALHTDHCIEELTDAIRDALATRTEAKSSGEVH